MLAHETARAIRERISSGDFRPGDKLNEIDLATDSGVSRNTLREAFVMLANQGVVNRFPNRGVFIAEPGAVEIRDVYRARMSIEPTALKWGPELDHAALLTQVEVAEKALVDGDSPAIAVANQRFHRAIVAAHASPSLDELMDKLLATMRLAFLEVQENLPTFHDEYVAQNREVVDLVGEGKRHEAAETLLTQLSTTSDRMYDLLREPGR